MSTVIDAALHIERAKCLYDVRRWKDAEVELRSALASDDARATAFYWLAWTLLRQDRLEEAHDASTLAIAADPEWGGGYLAHAAMLRKMGKLIQAEQAARNAVRKDPHYSGYRETLGWILLDRGQAREALDVANEGLKQCPDAVSLHQVRTEAWARLGDLPAAGESARHAAALDPRDQVTMAQLGAIAFRQKDLAAAQEHYVTALRIDPRYDFARNGLRETLKNRTWLYRLLAPKKKVKMTPGSYLGLVYLGILSATGAILAPWPIVVLPAIPLALVAFVAVRLYVGAALNPLLALVLRPNALGRATLSRDEIRCSDYVALLLAGALLSFLLMMARIWIAGLAGMLLLFLVIPVAKSFQRTGRERTIALLHTLGMAAAGASAIVEIALHIHHLGRYSVSAAVIFWIMLQRRARMGK